MIKRISLLTMLVLTVSSVAAPLKIGWATVDASTDKPIFLYGLPRRRVSEGLRDPITITSLAIDNGEDCVIFSSWDTCVVTGLVVMEVRKRIAALAPDVPLEKIIFNAIHTHTGPAFGNGYHDPVSMEYRKFFVEKAAEAVIKAWRARKPGKIGYGYDFAVTCFSRRPVYFDDLSKRPLPNGGVRIPGYDFAKHAKLHGNSNDKYFSHLEAAPDPFVNFLFTYDMNDKLTGMIFNIAFPTQVSAAKDTKLGSDCWSDVRRELKKEFGDIYLLPQCAAAGDLTYKMPYYYAARERKHQVRFGRPEAFDGEFERVRCTEQMMAALHRTLPWASKELFDDLPMRHVTEVVHLNRFTPTPEEVAEAKANLKKLREMRKNPPWIDPAQLKLGLFRINKAIDNCKRILQCDYEIRMLNRTTLPSEFHVLRIGDIAFVSERYELYTDYGQRIQARSPFTQTFTIQICAGLFYNLGNAAGYLPTARAVPNGGYQANPVNNDNAPSPEGGQQMVDEAVRLLYELKGEPEPPCPASAQPVPRAKTTPLTGEDLK